jgi:hypothetical protein
MPVQPMSTVYYNFYLNMWIMRKITEAQLQAKVPRYLTQAECDMIIATPQIPE